MSDILRGKPQMRNTVQERKLGRMMLDIFRNYEATANEGSRCYMTLSFNCSLSHAVNLSIF